MTQRPSTECSVRDNTRQNDDVTARGESLVQSHGRKLHFMCYAIVAFTIIYNQLSRYELYFLQDSVVGGFGAP